MKLRTSLLYCASALGRGAESTWANYLSGTAPGMQELSNDIPSRSIRFGMVPGELPPVDEGLDIRVNRLLKLAVDESRARLDTLISSYPAERIGIVLGASNTGIDEAEKYVECWLSDGEKPAEFDFSMLELGEPSSFLRGLIGAKGPTYTVSTACSSATKAFASAAGLIRSGRCDIVITGGVDGRCRFAMNGFHALGALSEGVCRPLAEDRDGINLGEAVALFAVGRDLDSPVSLRGVGESSDAYHATAPDPEGRGAEAAMRLALDEAGMRPEDIGYLNLHGTGTIANDAMEMKAVERVFARRFGESTKALTGHCLGAAGAIEAAISYLNIVNGGAKAAMSNSFAFGGSNASVVFSA